MKITRAACIPIITHDPYFSIWSNADHLNEDDLVHWSGKKQTIRGYVKVNETTYCFMGKAGEVPLIEQTEINVTANTTAYRFENEWICLKVTFVSPLLLNDKVLLGRPCTYIDIETEKKKDCTAEAWIEVYSDVVVSDGRKVVCCSDETDISDDKTLYFAAMGAAGQRPLGGSGDNVTIDWGYVFLATAEKKGGMCSDEEEGKICVRASLKNGEETRFVIAYDDLCSINYFGQWRKGYWTKEYKSILDAITSAVQDHDKTIQNVIEFDTALEKKAENLLGREYAYLVDLSYRQTIAAHKLIEDDEGNLIFLSKENDSNGCIGTVDVSYPSIPLFLLYDQEFVKGMLRPIFRFAETPVWKADYAPHDVGRYPYAWGQRYGLIQSGGNFCYSDKEGDVYPPFFEYSGKMDLYNFDQQMPVEECGNMLIMTAVVCLKDRNAAFSLPYLETLKKWSGYLLKCGLDPDNQLCTDDFAGHLGHNANLAVKAIMGIEALSQILKLEGIRDVNESSRLHNIAYEMAKKWEKMAYAGDHYALAYGGKESFSLKYNLIWDKLFNSHLFSDDVYKKETYFYIRKMNRYGVPLDSRKSYTKSDWILWCASFFDDREQARQMIKPIARYLSETATRYPFSDWYDTVTGEYCHFKGRSVQGGIFMPLLASEL